MTTNAPTQTAADILGPQPDHYSVDRAVALIDIITNKSRANATRADALDELLTSWRPAYERDHVADYVREQLEKVRAHDEQTAKIERDEQTAKDAQEAEAAKAAVRESDEPEITVTAEPAPVIPAEPVAPPSLAPVLADLLAPKAP